MPIVFPPAFAISRPSPTSPLCRRSRAPRWCTCSVALRSPNSSRTTAQAPLRPFTFVFSLPARPRERAPALADADPSRAALARAVPAVATRAAKASFERRIPNSVSKEMRIHSSLENERDTVARYACLKVFSFFPRSDVYAEEQNALTHLERSLVTFRERLHIQKEATVGETPAYPSRPLCVLLGPVGDRIARYSAVSRLSPRLNPLVVRRLSGTLLEDVYVRGTLTMSQGTF